MTEPTSPVPDNGSLDNDEVQAEESDPWRSAAEARRDAMPGPDSAEFARFREFMVTRQTSGNRAWRPRRDRSDDESERDNGGDRSNAGPAPSWDGTTAFKDYQIRARLWLATTRVKPKSRGPMLLKSLAGTPFDDMKYLAKDSAWMSDPENGEKLIQLMDSKELYGEDEREDMINTLVKITYTLRRTKGENNKAFFARWDNIVRRLEEHKVKLPEEYLGFLLTNALNLSNEELKLLLNFTQGRLKTKDVKEWLRVHETEFENKTSKLANPKANQVLLVGEAEPPDYGLDEEDLGEPDPDGIEVLLGAIQELDEGINHDGENENETVFDETEATEILAAMIKEHTKGGGKRSFPAVNKAKKAKALARGYGSGRDAGQRFREPPNVKVGNTYKVSIEALKRRTRCGICKEIGHWHRECPRNTSNNGAKENHFLESEEALFLDYIEYLDFKEQSSSASSTSGKGIGAPPGLSDPSLRAAYTVPVHEVLYVDQSEPVREDHCATVDTGCQRTAIGAETLRKFLANQDHQVGCCYKPEAHCFKSVNGMTSTSQIACLPTSLGRKGCILRPAIFEDGQSRQAPFLLSLPFLLYCRATLTLDPKIGLSMHLGRFNYRVPLHIGPTGALRVPLDSGSSVDDGRPHPSIRSTDTSESISQSSEVGKEADGPREAELVQHLHQEAHATEQRRRVQAVPGMAAVSGFQPAESVGIQLQGSDRIGPDRLGLPRRKLESELKRFEQIWSRLVECLGPDSERALCELKQQTVRELQRPSRKSLAFYRELFGMTDKQLRKVAEIHNPLSAFHRAKRSEFNAGQVLDIELGDDLLSEPVRQSVMTHLQHDRPGLVIIYSSRARPDQLFSLSRSFVAKDHANLKKHLDSTRQGRKLLDFALQVCQRCCQLGLSFVLDCPWPPRSWQYRWVQSLAATAGAKLSAYGPGPHRLHDPGREDRQSQQGVFTNHPSIAKFISNNGSPEGPKDRGGLNSLVVTPYAQANFRDPKEINVRRYQEICDGDRRIDRAYFAEAELHQIEHENSPAIFPDFTKEVLHQEDEAIEIRRATFPDSYEGAAEHLDEDGWHELSNGDWMHLARSTGNITVPEANLPAASLPWRSTWTKNGDQGWRLHEDEVRWQDLRDQQRRLPLQDFIATVYQAKIDSAAERKMRQFPGLRQVTLEKLVRRAHEGLGHPDNNRLVRILRQSQARKKPFRLPSL